MPRFEREEIFQWLQKILNRVIEQEEVQQSTQSHFEHRLALLERHLESISHKIDAMSDRLWKSQERDLSTSDEIARLRAEMISKATEVATARATAAASGQAKASGSEAGTEAGAVAGKMAGKKAAKIYSALVALLTLLLAFIEHCGEAVKKLGQ